MGSLPVFCWGRCYPYFLFSVLCVLCLLWIVHSCLLLNLFLPFSYMYACNSRHSPLKERTVLKCARLGVRVPFYSNRNNKCDICFFFAMNIAIRSKHKDLMARSQDSVSGAQGLDGS